MEILGIHNDSVSIGQTEFDSKRTFTRLHAGFQVIYIMEEQPVCKTG